MDRSWNNHINLLWPSSLLLNVTDDDGSNNGGSSSSTALDGYVIGWEETCYKTSQYSNAIVNILHDENKKDDDDLKEDNKCVSTTVVVAGILYDDIQKVQHALNILKHEKYPCNDKTCFACNFVIQELTVVAKWRDTRCTSSDTYDNVMRKNGNIIYSQGEEKKCSDLPIIEMTDHGPIVHSNHLYQLIVFDPCTNATDCYRHDLDFSTTYQRIKCSHRSRQRWQYGGDGGGQGRFCKLMLRLSETANVMNDLKEIMVNGGKTFACRSKNPSIVLDGDKERHGRPPTIIHDAIATVTATTTATSANQPVNPCINPFRASLFWCHLSFNRNACQKCSSMSGDPIQELVAQSPVLFFIRNHLDYYYLKQNARDDMESQHYVTGEYKANQRIQRFDSVSRCAMDALFGLVLGICLIYKSSFFIECASFCWKIVHKTILEDNIGWLETFPVGFKLNVPLTKVMGQSILAFSTMYENILVRGIYLVKSLLAIRLLGIISIVFGFRGGVSLIYDLAKISTEHIFIIQRFFHVVLRCQFSLFGSLWHLFRGKKKNVLRQRSDSLEYDFMQLFLGMILFAICLFLFTTILVYYTFFSLVHVLVSTCIGLLRTFHVIATYFPMGDVMLAYFEPGMFCSSISFAPLNLSPSSLLRQNELDTVLCRIRTTSLKPSWISVQAFLKRGLSVECK